MWTESGHHTEENKIAVGNFSGDQQNKWGRSSASYAKSIEGLSNQAWDEIETGVLEYAGTCGKRFKGPSNEDGRACIIDCDSDEDTSASSGDEMVECAEADRQTKGWDQWTGREPSACVQGWNSLCIESALMPPVKSTDRFRFPAVNGSDSACMEADERQPSGLNHCAGEPSPLST